MQGKIPVRYLYFCDGAGAGAHIGKKTYDETLKKLANREFSYYGDEGKAFYDAFADYSISGKSVLIWGLGSCNCDAMAIWQGAAKIYVVDYNKPVCEHPKITPFNHQELMDSGVKPDCCITFSSFEHDGLGRYGDPLSPDGDLLAMRQARDFLAKDGLMFLGMPLGKDCLLWNANRIYGEIRLPLLLKGFALLDVYNVYGNPSGDFPFDFPLGAVPQPLMVLKKIDSDFPDDAFFRERVGKAQSEADNADGKSTTRDCRMLMRILNILHEHKRSLIKQASIGHAQI
jgi:hypothetical protein